MSTLPPVMVSLPAARATEQSAEVCEARADPADLLISEYRKTPAAILPRRKAQTPFLFGILGLLNPAGCGGVVDGCQPFYRGQCSDTSASVTISGQERPSKFDYDLRTWTLGMLEKISVQQPCLLYGLASIAYVEELQIGDGNYNPQNRTIAVATNHIKSGIDTIERHQFIVGFRLAHEIGHHIHDTLFFDPPMGNTPCTELYDRFDAASVAGTDKDTETGDFLNGDAIKNADEDFAVCFAYYVVWPEKFRERVQTKIAATGDPNTPLAQKFALMRELFLGYEFPDSGI